MFNFALPGEDKSVQHHARIVRQSGACWWVVGHFEEERFWTLWGKKYSIYKEDIEVGKCPAHFRGGIDCDK